MFANNTFHAHWVINVNQRHLTMQMMVQVHASKQHAFVFFWGEMYSLLAGLILLSSDQKDQWSENPHGKKLHEILWNAKLFHKQLIDLNESNPLFILYHCPVPKKKFKRHRSLLK